MLTCRIYFDKIDSDDFVSFMRSESTGDNLDITRIERGLPSLSPEVSGLLVGGMGSAVAVLNIIFNYFLQKKNSDKTIPPGEIVINAKGLSLQFPSDISEEKKKEVISLLKEIASIQVTLKKGK